MSSDGSTKTESVDDSMIALMRLILAASALIIIYIDPAEPDRFVPVTYMALVTYTVYSAAIMVAIRRRAASLRHVTEWWHWIDVGWYVLLVALSSGTNSIFFFFFFFSILVASFRRGFWAGLRVVLVSVILFSIIGLTIEPAAETFEWNRFLLRPIYLAVLGYMMAYWGGHEIALKRRLSLLKEVSALSNPRFGVEQTLNIVIERLRTFYDAEACMLLMADSDAYKLYRASRGRAGSALRPDWVDPELAARLLSLPSSYAAFYIRHLVWRGRTFDRFHAVNLAAGNRSEPVTERGQLLATLLDAESFITTPLFCNKEVVGRIYLTVKRRHDFDNSDIDFLLQIFEQVMPVVENIRLVDRLASDAAEDERQRIARNIHDSVIQPYLGLQIGLGTVRQRLADAVQSSNGHSDDLTDTAAKMVQRLEQLIEMTNLGIGDLRSYISGLKGTGERDSSLLPSMHRFASKFSDVTGIAVQVIAENDLPISDRLAAEVFQMTVEGLSNVRRHTHAKEAKVHVHCSGGYLTLNIENDTANDANVSCFTPRSITNRAEALGGRLRVDVTGQGQTNVTVTVPL
jgi:signal transduction histidine kinase